MPTTLVLVGGPADRRTFTAGHDDPPPVWVVPLPSPVALALDPFAPAMPATAEYQQLWEYGAPSRDDAGAYRYRYVATRVPPHPGRRLPTPTLDELAEMPGDPPTAAYDDYQAHALACRTRRALARDARLTPAERAAVNAVVVADIRRALRERHQRG